MENFRTTGPGAVEEFMLNELSDYEEKLFRLLTKH